MRALLVRPRQSAEQVDIPDTLETLQSAVGGNIEMIESHGCALIIDEEGKLKNYEANVVLKDNGKAFDTLVGNILICGIDGEHFGDLSDYDLDFWEATMSRSPRELNL